MHLDEATPHLHIDYIPVAHGYKNGMKTRNSLTKAFQQMGFAKAVSRKQNETVAWQEREREYLTELCREQGIEIEVLGVQRDNLSLPEYKAAMREVEELEQQAVVLDKRNESLEQQNDDLVQKTAELRGQVQEMEVQNNELVLQAQKLTEQIEEAEIKEKAAKEVLAKHDLRAETFKMISKEVAAETKKMKSVAVPVTNLFGSEEYVKVKKSDWNKMLDAFSKAVSRNHLLEKYEKKISNLEQKIAALTNQVEKLKRFVASRGLEEAFVEFVKSLAPKTMKQRLEDAKSDAMEHNQQRKNNQQDIVKKNKQWQQEM
jgi:regulator of replication initiation timing